MRLGGVAGSGMRKGDLYNSTLQHYIRKAQPPLRKFQVGVKLSKKSLPDLLMRDYAHHMMTS